MSIGGGKNELYDLFEQACALEGEAREQLLLEVAARDVQLAAELRALLAADEGLGSVPRDPGAPARPKGERALLNGGDLDVERLRAEVAELAARSRGGERYRLDAELGRGAMGVVRRVVDLPLGRELAMKTIRADAGGETDEPVRLARFLNEARILGRLSHPGIISIHELGLDAEGRAYFTMPIVAGGDLRDAFAKARSGQESWSLARAVGVLQRVCEAMAFAHASGVVHRDLKPSNVMVGRLGEIQVMDWGVACVRGEADARDLRPRPRSSGGESCGDSPVRTMDGAVIGTPHFMSPEQALGRAQLVDERSDVYAVGAMLYELLADRRPYEEPGSDGAPYVVLARLLEGPPALLGDVAPEAPPELVAIAEKAMAREPSARYATMEAMASDLRAFLEVRVVRAYRTGAWEELVKWTRRNRGMATALAAALVALLGGAVAVAVLERRNARRERELGAEVAAEKATALQALEAKQEALAVAEKETAKARNELETRKQTIALMESLFRAPQPEKAQGREITAREILDYARKELEQGTVTEPEVLGTLQLTLGGTYKSLGDYDRSTELLSSGMRHLESALGSSHPDVLAWKPILVEALERMDRIDEAIALSAEILDASLATFELEDERTILAMSRHGRMLGAAGQYEEGDALIEEAYRLSSERFGPRDDRTLGVGKSLLPVLGRLDRTDEALELARAILDNAQATRGEFSPELLYSMDDLGNVLSDAGRFEEAEELIRASFDKMMRVLGPDHEHTYYASNNLGSVYWQAGRLEEAREQFEFTLANRERLLGPSHALTLKVRANLADVLMDSGNLDEAERLSSMNYTLARDQGTSVDTRLRTIRSRGAIQERRGDLEAAVGFFEEARALQEGTGAPPSDVAETLEVIVRLHLLRRDIEAAARGFEELLDLAPAERASNLDALAAELDAARAAEGGSAPTTED